MEENVGFIGLFQLENLHNNRVPYLLINLIEDFSAQTLPEKLKKILVGAQSMKEAEVLDKVKKLLPSPHLPIVLLCEDSQCSMKVAAVLESNQYINTYVIRDGLRGLLQEIEKIE